MTQGTPLPRSALQMPLPLQLGFGARFLSSSSQANKQPPQQQQKDEVSMPHVTPRGFRCTCVETHSPHTHQPPLALCRHCIAAALPAWHCTLACSSGLERR